MARTDLHASDESFISFSFAIVSVLLIVLYIPWLIGKTRRVYLFYNATKKEQSSMTNPMDEVWSSLSYLPRVVKTIMKDPSTLIAGAKVCIEEKVFFIRCVMPKFLRFVIRPRILLPLVWVVLFSSAMYASLTFDPHAILGLPTTASTNEIKKTYRALSKRYHPDLNKTAEARDIYVQVRRAYKALVDREAFEEEEKAFREFTVGVALPSFLISHQYDTLVLFGLLGMLFLIPLYVWYTFTNDKKVPKLLWQIRFDKERVERFMRHFGFPEDPKYTARRDSASIILQTLIKLNIVPANVREDVVRPFPPLPDFVRRCINADANAKQLAALGLQPNMISALRDYMKKNGEEMVKQFEAAHPANDKSKAEFMRISPSAYTATRYLFTQHTIQVDRALVELQVSMNGELPSAKKLLTAHKEMYDMLDTVYLKSETPPKHMVDKLIEMPGRVAEIVDAIEPEMQLVYHRYYKHYMAQMQAQAEGAHGHQCDGSHSH